jgi:hypothetical protein
VDEKAIACTGLQSPEKTIIINNMFRGSRVLMLEVLVMFNMTEIVALFTSNMR